MNKLSFRELEAKIPDYVNNLGGSTSLTAWYEAARDKDLRDFDDRDLSIACRQALFPEFTVPRALARLNLFPLAGDMYDGELLMAMRYIPTDYWRGHPSQAGRLEIILASIVDAREEQFTPDLKELERVLKLAKETVKNGKH